VLARALVGEGVELEVDLVVAAREPDGEGRSVVTAFESRDEAVRQAEIEEACRRGVEPVFWEPEVPSDPISSLSTSRVVR